MLFPQGQLFEDINTIYRTFLKSEYVVYSGTIGYYYRIRKGAITQIKNIHHALQRITAQQQRYVDLAEQKKNLSQY